MFILAACQVARRALRFTVDERRSFAALSLQLGGYGRSHRGGRRAQRDTSPPKTLGAGANSADRAAARAAVCRHCGRSGRSNAFEYAHQLSPLATRTSRRQRRRAAAARRQQIGDADDAAAADRHRRRAALCEHAARVCKLETRRRFGDGEL